MKKIYCFLSVALLAGCGTVQLKDNVKVNQDTSVKSVEYVESSKASFKDIKKCAALTIKNEDVRLKDASRSFVGAYTGNIYNYGNAYTDFASKDNVYLDEKDQQIVVNGNTDYSAYGISYTVRFRLNIDKNSNLINMTFDNIKRAQHSTGYSENDGFNPIYTHVGAHADLAMNSIEEVKNDFMACLSK